MVGNQRICGAMGLVEPILGELFHKIENFIRLTFRHIAGKRAFQKNTTLLGHLLRFFLAHGAAQQVCPSQRISRGNLGDLHYLFLIDHSN